MPVGVQCPISSSIGEFPSYWDWCNGVHRPSLRFPYLVFSIRSYLPLHFNRFHDNLSTDISSTTLRLQTFRLLLYTSVQDSYTSKFSFSKSLFSSIPTSTYTMILFINPTSTDTMIIQHI